MVASPSWLSPQMSYIYSMTSHRATGRSTRDFVNLCKEVWTRLLLSLFQRHPVDTMIAEPAGELGRQWLPAHRSIDGADLAIANLNKVNSRDTHTRCGSTFGDPAPSANDC